MGFDMKNQEHFEAFKEVAKRYFKVEDEERIKSAYAFFCGASDAPIPPTEKSIDQILQTKWWI